MGRYELTPSQLEEARRLAAATWGLSEEQAATLDGRTRQEVDQAALRLARETSEDPGTLARALGRRHRH